MNRVLAALSLIVLPVAAWADFGIGASFKSGEGGIYVPVTITPRVFFEPYFQYSDSETTSTLADSTSPGTDSSFTSISVGAGLFGVSKLSDDIEVYYGARAAYVSQESSSTALILSPFPPLPANLPRTEFDADGWSLAPTIGFQYFLTDRLSLGAEARWEFSDLSGTSTSTNLSGGTSRIDQTFRANNTRTDVLLRFYFK